MTKLIGLEPNQVPLNQFLGSLAYQGNSPTLKNLLISSSSSDLLSLNSSNSRLSLGTQTLESTPTYRRWLTYPFKSYSHSGGGLSTGPTCLVTELDWIISNYPGGTSSTIGTWEDNTSYWDSITSAYGFNINTDIILHNRVFIGGRSPREADDKECGLWIAPGGINGGTNTATNASITYGPVIDTDFGGGGTTGALSAKIRLSGYVRGSGSDGAEFASINFDSQIHPYNGNFTKGKSKIWAKNELNYSVQQYGSSLVFGTSQKGPATSTQTYYDRLQITDTGYIRLLTNSSGIQFNGDTAAANALDDYEEGTQTPVITSSGVTIVQGQDEGYYTKIGNLVYYSFSSNFTTASPSGSNALFVSLPFVVASANYGGGNGNGLCAAMNSLGVRAYAVQGTSTMALTNIVSGEGLTPTSIGAVSNVVRSLHGTIVYRTSA